MDGFPEISANWLAEIPDLRAEPLPDVLGMLQSFWSAVLPRTVSRHLTMFFLVFRVGRRQLQKETVPPHRLGMKDAILFKQIEKQFANPVRLQRVMEFMRNSEITGRLLNYFVVVYSANYPVTYELDRSSYPYRISKWTRTRRLGCELVDLHDEYQKAKMSGNRRNNFAPYARSVAVQSRFGPIVLCQCAFYLWLDSICGFEALIYRLSDVKAKKIEHDEKRQRKKTQVHGSVRT